MQAPTGPDSAASYYPGSDPANAAPAAPQPQRWGNIPQELRERAQWLIAIGKVPNSCTDSGVRYQAGATHPWAWLSFRAAVSLASIYGCGIGYVLDASDPFTCIDLDVKDSTTPGQLALYSRMLHGFDTYAERSMSGRGLHIWCRGKVGKGVRRDGVEVYSQERFIVCTGDVVLDRPIRDRQDYLNNMVSQMRALGTVPAELVELPPLESDADQWQRKARSDSGAKFQTLWFGGWEALGYPSQSEADMALVRMLCFNNPSNEQVRRLFRLSALGQRKKAARVDYVDGMIAAARAADVERERVHAQAAAAMAPGIDAELEAWRARVRGNLG